MFKKPITVPRKRFFAATGLLSKFQPSIFDKIVPLYRHDGTVRLLSDVSFIINDKRLADHIGEYNMSKIVRALNAPYQNPTKGISDEQILDHVRSRHVQSLSEVVAYSRHLQQEAAEKVRDINADITSTVRSAAAAQARRKAASAPKATVS